MTDRSYTVAEIDALRRACELKYMGNIVCWCIPMSEYAKADRLNREQRVENYLRTHMLAGHVAKDIEATLPKPYMSPRQTADEAIKNMPDTVRAIFDERLV